MADREKVIEALKHCFPFGKDGCRKCPYIHDVNPEKGCTQNLTEDIISLLKEQEPRVMTLEEIVQRAGEKDPDPIFVEWRISGYTQWSVASIGIVASAVKSEPEFVRAWTSRPTDEQRKAVAWDD